MGTKSFVIMEIRTFVRMLRCGQDEVAKPDRALLHQAWLPAPGAPGQMQHYLARRGPHRVRPGKACVLPRQNAARCAACCIASAP